MTDGDGILLEMPEMKSNAKQRQCIACMMNYGMLQFSTGEMRAIAIAKCLNELLILRF